MYLDSIKLRCRELDILGASEVIPCTEEEVCTLEKQLGLSLPGAYREFLLWMGHDSNTFLVGSTWAYNRLWDLQKTAQELLEENGFPQSLPRQAFVFFMHQGYTFNFYCLDEGDDPPIYRYNEAHEQAAFPMIFSRFSDFLASEIELHLSARSRWISSGCNG
jgi:hypothetical protein